MQDNLFHSILIVELPKFHSTFKITLFVSSMLIILVTTINLKSNKVILYEKICCKHFMFYYYGIMITQKVFAKMACDYLSIYLKVNLKIIDFPFFQKFHKNCLYTIS